MTISGREITKTRKDENTKRRIATDGQIDQLVFELYVRSDNQIALVEEATP